MIKKRKRKGNNCMDVLKDILYECKYLLIFSSVVILFLVSYGFMENIIFVDVPEEVTRYCEVKYGETFTWLNFVQDSSDLYSKTSKVRSEDTGLTFLVKRYYSEDKEVLYEDNYCGYLSMDYIKSELGSKMPKDATYSVFIDDSKIEELKDPNIEAGNYIDRDSIIKLHIKDNHIWSFKEAEVFCKELPFRVNVVLSCGKSELNFATTKDFDVIYR